jgi:hypothetical protein
MESARPELSGHEQVAYGDQNDNEDGEPDKARAGRIPRVW